MARQRKAKVEDELDQLAFDILNEGKDVDPYASIYKTQDKISNMIGRDIQDVTNNVEHMIPVGIDRSGDQVITRIQLSCDDPDEEYDKNLQKVKKLSPLLRCTLDSLLTLYIHKGGQPFTLNQVYRVLMGKESSASPTKKQMDELLRAVNTLSRIGITIFLEDEIESYGEKDGWGITPQKKWISGTLFPCELIAIGLNGSETIAVRPLGPPILFRYALPKKQLLSHSMDLITKTKGKISTNRVILLDFLIRYVSMLFVVKKPMTNNGVKFETLYKICDVDVSHSEAADLTERERNTITKRKKRIRDETIDILNDWKKLGHIKDYRLEIKGRSPYKFYVEINEDSLYAPSLFTPNDIH